RATISLLDALPILAWGYSAAAWPRLESSLPPSRAAWRAARRSAARSAAVCAAASAMLPSASTEVIAATRRVRWMGNADMSDLVWAVTRLQRRVQGVPKLTECRRVARADQGAMTAGFSRRQDVGRRRGPVRRWARGRWRATAARRSGRPDPGEIGRAHV